MAQWSSGTDGVFAVGCDGDDDGAMKEEGRWDGGIWWDGERMKGVEGGLG
ncbi:hypothetical protein SESBI_13842 [Sesbania bispinosa]|nr:hypothetical protein SESBI_13842 [Sesbania bispinosa]